MVDPDIRQARTALEELSADQEARRIAEDRVLWRWIYDREIAKQLELGLELGRAEGREEAREEALREAMLDAITMACEVFAVDLGGERVFELESATLDELKALYQGLLRCRDWPA